MTKKQLADQWMSVSAYCLVCVSHLGWRCKESPDGVCHYYVIDGEVTLIDGTQVDAPDGCETSIECIYCGHPEERK